MDELDRLFQCVVRAVRDAQPEYLSRAFEVGDLLEFVPYRTVRSEIGVETNDDFAHAVTRLLSGERGYVFADDLMQDDLKAELASPNPDLGAYRTYVNAHVTLSQEHARMVIERMGATAAVGATSEHGSANGHEVRAPIDSPLIPAPTVAAAAPPVEAAAPSVGAAAPVVADTAPPAPPTRTEAPVPRASSPGTPRPAPPRTAPARRAPALSPRPIDPDTVAAPRPSRPGCRYCGQQLPDARDINFCPSCGQDLRARRCAACSAELETGWKFCVACGRAAST